MAMPQTAPGKTVLAGVLLGTGVLLAAAAAHAGSQSSNTSSNSSSNNGVVRERIVDTYCENGYCERRIDQRLFRDDRGDRWRRHRPYR